MVPELVFDFEHCMWFKNSIKINTFTTTMYNFHNVSATYLEFFTTNWSLPRLILLLAHTSLTAARTHVSYSNDWLVYYILLYTRSCVRVYTLDQSQQQWAFTPAVTTITSLTIQSIATALIINEQSPMRASRFVSLIHSKVDYIHSRVHFIHSQLRSPKRASFTH